MKASSQNLKITPVLGYFAAGTTKRTSSIIDMDGFDGVVFVALLGTTIEAGTVLVDVEQNISNATSGMAALAGTAAYTVPATPGALTAIAVDVFQPKERYLQSNITPASQNAVICGMIAIQYNGHTCPVTQPATLVKTTRLVNPAEAA